MKILLIQTGGTIDKDYPRVYGSRQFEISEPGAKRILERMDPAFKFEFVTLFRKDSLDLSIKDRHKILEFVLKSKAEKILITHGTDTIPETARILHAGLKESKKLVILTGAIRPERFSDSDAEFNIGTAIGALNTLKSGVYVAMNGRIFDGNNCVKNHKTCVFEERF